MPGGGGGGVRKPLILWNGKFSAVLERWTEMKGCTFWELRVPSSERSFILISNFSKL